MFRFDFDIDETTDDGQEKFDPADSGTSRETRPGVAQQPFLEIPFDTLVRPNCTAGLA